MKTLKIIMSSCFLLLILNSVAHAGSSTRSSRREDGQILECKKRATEDQMATLLDMISKRFPEDERITDTKQAFTWFPSFMIEYCQQIGVIEKDAE